MLNTLVLFTGKGYWLICCLCLHSYSYFVRRYPLPSSFSSCCCLVKNIILNKKLRALFYGVLRWISRLIWDFLSTSWSVITKTIALTNFRMIFSIPRVPWTRTVSSSLFRTTDDEEVFGQSGPSGTRNCDVIFVICVRKWSGVQNTSV